MIVKSHADDGADAPPTYAEAMPDYAETLTWTTEPPRHVLGECRAHASLALPVALDELYVMARGEHARGDFEISLTGDRGPDTAVVDVDATYHHEHALDEVVVCHLKPRDGKQGLGIFTKDGQDRKGFDRSLHFHVHLRLPAPLQSGSSPLLVNYLSTDLPAFTHHFRNLGGGVTFKRAKLETSLCAIYGETIEGEDITLVTSNSQVRGNFSVSKSLHLETSNAPITIHAELTNCDEAEPTQMSMRTTNGRIEAAIALQSGTSADCTGGTFRVTAQTTNAPASVIFQRLPVDACLDATIQTTSSPARVTMHPAYEGQFELRSSPYVRPSVHEISTIGDPAGRGRVRMIETHAGMGDVHGRVWWEVPLETSAEVKEVRRSIGHLSVETSNSPLDFIL